MNRLLCILALLALHCVSMAQDDPDSLHATAKKFMRSGDYANAIIVLNRALKQSPGDLPMLEDLAFSYYLQRNYSMALETARPLVERKDADEQAYQILGVIYTALEEKKDCEKMYRQGLKRFPNSGVLYNEYGEMLWARQDAEAIRQWEKGIEVDPNYPSNYYNAAKFYYFTYDKVWSLIYGEIFVNLESYSKRTPEIKNILVESYKKLFADPSLTKNQNVKNPFVQAYLTVMNDQAPAIAAGIHSESLTALRSKFLLEWFDKFAARFPFRLFEYQRQLLREGMFDAYNQWIFGTAQDLVAFQGWTASHPEEYDRFLNFQKGRVLKMPAGQYYHPLTMK